MEAGDQNHPLFRIRNVESVKNSQLCKFWCN